MFLDPGCCCVYMSVWFDMQAAADQDPEDGLQWLYVRDELCGGGDHQSRGGLRGPVQR